MKLFSWIGKLFVGTANDAASQIVHDEIQKVHDEITQAVIPLLSQIPAGDRQKLLDDLVGVAKQAAVAYVEAYISSHAPQIVPTTNPVSTDTPGQ